MSTPAPPSSALRTSPLSRPGHRAAAPLLAALLLAACTGDPGATGPMGPPGQDGTPGTPGTPGTTPPIRTELTRFEELPGLVLEVLSVGTTLGAPAAPGATLAVTFTVRKKDGGRLPIEELDHGELYVSGPTHHYQLVHPPQADLGTRSILNADGSYTYVFAAPIPATYPAPLNDSAAFGPGDGELQGQPLLAGTYTVGLEASKDYTVEGEALRDAGGAHADFLLGGATTLEPRQVTRVEGCNACHQELRAHGSARRNLVNCLLCHTRGAEDRNTPGVAGGTPGVTIEFGAMVHRIHDGKHLPSVLGVTTDATGARDYGATPTPLQYLGLDDVIADFSAAAFPVWPGFNIAMPRDAGYETLPSPAKTREDEIRRGVTACDKCHGDPDGAGPLTAPAQGHLAYDRPTRGACGSCHDDVVWTRPYAANGRTMPPQADDTGCATCHPESGGVEAVRDGHRHPLLEPALNGGLRLSLLSLTEAGAVNGDGNLDVGEKVAVTLALTDDSGAAVAPAALASLNFALSGPTTNYNLLLYSTLPIHVLAGAPPYAFLLPMPVFYEFQPTFVSTAALDTFTTAQAPHWNPPSGTRLTSVFVRVATPNTTTITAVASAGQNYVDVASGTGLVANDYVVVDDDSAGEEYHRIGLVEGTRVWFTTPASYAQLGGLRAAHPIGATLKEVTLVQKAFTTDYTESDVAGSISEVTEFGAANKVILSYTTDFVVPPRYPTAPFDSPDVDDTFGEWAGQPLSEGTYTLTAWGYRPLCVTPARVTIPPTGTTCPAAPADTTTYRATSPGAKHDFLLGVTPGALRPYGNISGSGTTCNACHDDVYFHGGGRRGFDTCIACHGVAGAELRLGETGAPSTVKFAQFLHGVHRDRFPSQIGGARDCAMCHGTAVNWKSPPARAHGDPAVEAFLAPIQIYRVACSGCHFGPASVGHFDVMTSPSGEEACATCHDADSAYAIEVAHRGR